MARRTPRSATERPRGTERLYAGLSHVPQGSPRVERWDGAAWTPFLPNGALDDSVLTMVVFDDGRGAKLYLGGCFQQLDGVDVNGVVSWDGTDFEPLAGVGGVGVEADSGEAACVRALEVHDAGGGAQLYVGGDFDR